MKNIFTIKEDTRIPGTDIVLETGDRIQILESDDNDVKVYVGTYGKYADSSLKGDWMTPAEYDSLEGFYSACKELHKDEDDPELMFQDTENLPWRLYDESYFSEDAFDYAKFIYKHPEEQGAAEAYVNLFGGWDEDDFEERYRGEWDSMEDFCMNFVDECGGIGEAVSDPSAYFDYEQFGRDLKMDLDEDDEYEARLLNMEDDKAAETYIDDVYGSVDAFAKSDPKHIETYFDWDKYARDCSYDIAHENGYFFWNN